MAPFAIVELARVARYVSEHKNFSVRASSDAGLNDGNEIGNLMGGFNTMLAEIEEFITGRRTGVEITRKLLTIIFTDVVSSTERASELGDEGWRHAL